jgi:formamidopyrimidine-DNA glycosylase
MPELPDVAQFKMYFDATSLHQRIRQVIVQEADLLEAVSARRLRSELKGSEFAETHRHGKYLFARFRRSGWLVLHFGMTGSLDFAKDGELPDHTRATFRFRGGYRLAYVNQRKLGMIALADDPDSFAAQRDLGPDALDDRLTFDRFAERLEGRRGRVKPAIMNQSIIAGVGNIYSDEILFQAGVSPLRPVDRLDRKTLRSIYRTMRRVLRVAIRHNACAASLPRSYLLPHRDGDARCPRCGGKLETVKVSGRTAHFCPNCQR